MNVVDADGVVGDVVAVVDDAVVVDAAQLDGLVMFGSRSAKQTLHATLNLLAKLK